MAVAEEEEEEEEEKVPRRCCCCTGAGTLTVSPDKWRRRTVMLLWKLLRG